MDVTVARTTYGPLLRAADVVAALGARVGVFPRRLDARAVRERAMAITGLSDFGEDDLEEPMGVAIATAESRDLTALGRVIVERAIVQAAVTRLRLVERERAGPLPEVRAPIFVLGFPRTGTTLLHNLLAQHPSRRALAFWELTTPMPVLDDPAADERARMRTAEQMLRAAYLATPELAVIHATRATTAEECWPLFAPSFAVLNWDLGMGLEAYGDWLMAHDMRGAYRRYRKLLGALLEQRPADGLVLKCPEHLWFLDALLDVFPDGRVVWTHRDPFPVIASYCSMMSLQWRSLYGRFDPVALGRHLEDRLVEGVERALRVRDEVGEDRFHDVRFADLARDPVAVVGGIERAFGGEPTDPALLERFLAVKRSDGRGRHVYDPAMYGLDEGRIRERLAVYTERFGIGR
ncbi:MAG: sulfotransferase [Alphaproteobacteria bacterium]|nr:sulfotransferase [Alphaproteobacteria bacterium]MCB9693376.1 sulfotransferase [Alphaproteobacteria bacterium]